MSEENNTIDPLLDTAGDYVKPADRTPQDWIDFYLQIESDVLEGKQVTFDSGRIVLMEDLAQIRKGRHEWERKLNASKRKTRQTLGGFRYKTADMSR